MIQDEKIVVIDRNGPAIDVAMLRAAPCCPDREGVGVWPELGVSGTPPNDAILAAPFRMEPIAELGIGGGEIWQRTQQHRASSSR